MNKCSWNKFFDYAVACTNQIAVSKEVILYQEAHLRVLRLLEINPQMKQREIAAAAGVSLGKTNYCIKAWLEKGLIKVRNFKSHKRKLAYAYLLTPAGIAEKSVLTQQFLQRKMEEYEALKAEIEMLKLDIEDRWTNPYLSSYFDCGATSVHCDDVNLGWYLS